METYNPNILEILLFIWDIMKPSVNYFMSTSIWIKIIIIFGLIFFIKKIIKLIKEGKIVYTKQKITSLKYNKKIKHFGIYDDNDGGDDIVGLIDKLIVFIKKERERNKNYFQIFVSIVIFALIGITKFVLFLSGIFLIIIIIANIVTYIMEGRLLF